MSRVALYARKSKPPSDWRPAADGELPPTSVETQVARLQKHMAALGHGVVMVETDTASGANPNRPGWRRVLSAIDGGHVQQVWMTRPDRAMRSTKHYLEVVERCQKRGVHLEFLDQPASSVRGKDDAMAVAFRTVQSAFNQLTLDLAREASMEVLERDPEDGKLYGPRSELPAGRPVEFGPEHKFRVRGGSKRHDRARCTACRGQTGGVGAMLSGPPEIAGVAKPGGLATPESADSASQSAGAHRAEAGSPANVVEVANRPGGA